MSAQAYPLLWPVGQKRTEPHRRVRSRFGKWNAKPSVARACDEVLHELRLFDARQVSISSNVQLRNDGLPRSNQRTPDDTGVAVYFHKGGEQLVIACDTFDLVGCNLYAVARTVNAWRQMERDGCSDILKRMFTGFKALPEQGSRTGWRHVLGVPEQCEWRTVHFAYRVLCKQWHPDVPGGDAERFQAVQDAYEDAKREYKMP